MSGLIWVKTICKGYQHTSHVGKDLTYEFDMLYYKQINVFRFCFSAVPLYDSSYFNGFTRGMENYMYWLYHVSVCLFVFVALHPMSTAMVIAGRSVHLTTLFPGQA